MISIPKLQRAILTLLLLLALAFYLSRDSEMNSAARIAILSMTTTETTYDWMSISNKYEYASKHSYDLIWSFTASTVVSNYAKPWDKLDMIRDAVQATVSGQRRYEWLWMLDYDTLITSPEIRVEEIIEQSLELAEIEGKDRDSIQLILTRDCEPLNAGSFFVRVTPWTIKFIEEWRSGQQPETPNRTEQDVLRDMLLDNVLGVADHSVVVPQTMFNAYPEELGHCRDPRDARSWEEGMFLIHFPGAKWWLKEEDAVGDLMRKYYQRAFPGRKLS